MINTHRLTLRPFTRDDSAFIVSLLNTPGFLKNIGDRGIRRIEDAWRYLEEGPFNSYRMHGFGLCLAQVQDTAEPLGMTGLTWKPWLADPDIAYAFLPHAEGKGYATEAARGVVDFAFGTMKLPRLAAVVVPRNRGSIRVLEKLGFTETGTVTDPRDETMLSLLALTNTDR